MTVFIFSAMIVVFYCLWRVVVRPPEVEAMATVTIQPSDDPNTEEDESRQGPQTVTLERKEDFHTFLLMGSDDGNGNADTIMVGAYDLKNGKLSVLSVPRDTLVDVSRTVKKINAAYGAGGVQQLLDELAPILGFRPDHYIKVDVQAFVDVVNILGPISYYVPEDMYHDDGAGFIINLKEGLQALNGQQALQLVRYRGYKDMSSDLGRIRTQQKFLREVAKQAASWTTVAKVPALAQTIFKYLDTDLSATELTYFASAALSLDFANDISFGTLPGDGTVHYGSVKWYYQLEPEGTLALINQLVNPYTTDITPEMTHIFQVQ